MILYRKISMSFTQDSLVREIFLNSTTMEDVLPGTIQKSDAKDALGSWNFVAGSLFSDFLNVFSQVLNSIASNPSIVIGILVLLQLQRSSALPFDMRRADDVNSTEVLDRARSGAGNALQRGTGIGDPTALAMLKNGTMRHLLEDVSNKVILFPSELRNDLELNIPNSLWNLRSYFSSASDLLEAQKVLNNVNFIAMNCSVLMTLLTSLSQLYSSNKYLSSGDPQYKGTCNDTDLNGRYNTLISDVLNEFGASSRINPIYKKSLFLSIFNMLGNTPNFQSNSELVKFLFPEASIEASVLNF